MIKTKYFVICIVVLLCVSVGIFAYQVYLSNTVSDGVVAEIYLDGELVRKISLSDVDKPYTFEVEGGDGIVNVISVEKGRICVSSADCPDGLCVKQGWRSGGVTPIVCLPNRLVINFKNVSDNGDDIDGAIQ